MSFFKILFACIMKKTCFLTQCVLPVCHCHEHCYSTSFMDEGQGIMRGDGAFQWSKVDGKLKCEIWWLKPVGCSFLKMWMQIVFHTWLTLAGIDHLHMSWQIQTHSWVHFKFLTFACVDKIIRYRPHFKRQNPLKTCLCTAVSYKTSGLQISMTELLIFLPQVNEHFH